MLLIPPAVDARYLLSWPAASSGNYILQEFQLDVLSLLHFRPRAAALGVAKTLSRPTPDVSACRGLEGILYIPADPKSLVLQQPPLETHDNIPSYLHPIILPPKNETRSWENKIGLPHQEPAILEASAQRCPMEQSSGTWTLATLLP